MAFAAWNMLVASAAMVATPPMQAGEPVAAKPLAKWRMDYGNNECRLIRAFGDAARPMTFQLSKIDPERNVAPALALASAEFRPSAGDTRIVVTADGQKTAATLIGDTMRVTSDAPPIIYVMGAGALADLLAADIAVDRASLITFAVNKRRMVLALGKMAAPLNALNACMDDLMRTWGYDPDVQRALTAPAVPVTPPVTWISSSDYPIALSSASKAGGVTARLDVSETGAIAGCHTMEAGGDPAFERLTCDLIRKRGMFKPATGKDGRAVATYYPMRVMWRAAR